MSTSTTYPISVDYSQSLEVMVSAGKYDCVYTDMPGDITQANFPHDRTRGVEEIEIELIKYDADMESRDLVTDLASRREMRPATIEELCAFGASYPDVQRQFPIAAFGSPCVSPARRPRVPILTVRCGHERILCIDWCDYGWPANYRFAVVRQTT